jgi:hypothetical protein
VGAFCYYVIKPMKEHKTTMNSEQKTFDLAATEFTITVNPYPQLKKPILTTHVLGRPTFDDEDRRERMMPVITKEAGKVENSSASQTELDEVPANVALYNKIIKKMLGYEKVAGEGAPAEGLAPEDIVQGRNADGEPTEMKAIDAIPDSHKSLAINGIFQSSRFEVEEKELQAFSLGAGREWVLIQSIGGKTKQEDGTLSPADYTIKYTFQEPSAAHLKKFRTLAFAAVSWKDANGFMRDRRTVVLSVINELFNALVRSVEGFVVNGEAFDVRNPDHLSKIFGTYKKEAMLKLFIFLQADLGDLGKK